MTTIDNYYNRFDPAKEYDAHMFRAGYVLQAAELNEMQSAQAARTKGIADVLFTDGAVVRDARVSINPVTGVTVCEAGAIYAKGAVRGVTPANITIPVMGQVYIGVYVVETTLTEIDDPLMRDPAINFMRNYQKPGAGRLKVHLNWGYEGDGQDGTFYRCYEAIDGLLRIKEPPPNIDAITQSIARYDRDSAGGNYVISGLQLEALADVGNNQQYILHEGRARVNGFPVELQTARRIFYNALPDLHSIASEPKASTSVTAFRFNADYTPIAAIQSVQITSEMTSVMVHGSYIGAMDLIPKTSVLSITSIVQGGTTYVAGVDYQLTAGKVDWSLNGAEPSTGSTYSVTFRYIQTVTPTAIDDMGFTVAGALVGTLVLATYTYKMPRVDRFCIDPDGNPVWIKGVASDQNPRFPAIPAGHLWLAAVTQLWDSTYRLRDILIDAPKMIPMSELSKVQSKLDFVVERILEDRLKLDINARENGIKKGMFVDPFTNDTMRDQGVAQTAAIVRGELMLPITTTIFQMPNDITQPALLGFTLQTVLEQPLQTGSIAVNPYMSFAPIPALVDVVPAVDRWTDTDTTWSSPITNRVVTGSGSMSSTTTAMNEIEVGSTTTEIETLRQIPLTVSASGFNPGEHLLVLEIDGINITSEAT